jgi:hypothetical protein
MDYDDPFGVEDWEDDKILYEKEDWPNLLKCLKILWIL